MRVAIVIPATGLIAGAALGVLLPDGVPDRFSHVLLVAGLLAAASLALWAWLRSRVRPLAVFVGLAFLAGGVLLGSYAWRQAWRPSLRLAFDDLAAMEREDAAATGRVLPEEPGVAVVLMGTLRADAAVRDTTVSLSVDVTALDTGAACADSRESHSAPGDSVWRSAGPPSEPSALSPAAPPPQPPWVALDLVRFPASCTRPVRGGVLLTVVGDLAMNRAGQWRAGRVIRAPAQVRRPSRYLDPGVPDEERALARRGTSLVGTVKSGALVDVVSLGSPWAEAAASTRAFVRRAVADGVGAWSTRAAAIVTAIVIGDRAGLDAGVQRRLQEAGTYHVIAISGGNIAILAGLTLGAFRIAGVLGPAAMLCAITGLTAYAYLVGGGASVDRATLMAVVYFAARAVDLRGAPFNALVLVAATLVAADPLTIADPAFLLTFGATAAILAVMPAVASLRVPRLVVPIVAMLAASAAAETALLPVGAAVFSRVTFAGLVLNFAAIPLMAVAQIAGMLLVAVAIVSSWCARVVGWVAFVAAEGLVRSADLVQLAPFVTWRVAPPHWVAIVSYYAALVVVWVLWRRASGPSTVESAFSLASSVVSGFNRTAALRASLALLVVSAAWILFQPWAWLTPRGDGRLHVTFIDVGQGDAAFVRFPGGDTLLVDTGGSTGSSAFDIGDRVVAPVLRRAGVRRLGGMALTHGDADHIGGAPSLLDEFRPRDVWEGIPVPPLELLQAVRATARRVGAWWTNVQTADVTSIDGVEVVVRHPGLADWERQDVRNDDSIVLELRWGEVSVVLTGDIGREAEQAIAPDFPPSTLRVIKVPHHGSLTSSSPAFLRALAPRLAVVSVGRSNAFGHPAPAVLARYRDAGAEIFRTDRDGAVTVTTDGASIQVETFTGRTLTMR
jgi:competence protein ComEC